MINPMKMFFASAKAKLYQMTYGIKKYFNPRYLGRIISVQVKKITQSLFSIKPMSTEDYYNFGGWAVSKKLAILVVVLINMGAIMLLLNLLPAKSPKVDGAQKLPAYKYTSLRLYGFNGGAQVLSSKGKLVYSGALEKGEAKGVGNLYDLEGKCVYVGEFDHNMYNGKGTLYSEKETPLYVGDFVDNMYSGIGTLYYPNNTPKYQGEFAESMFNGTGSSFSEDGRLIYEGQFIRNHIDFLKNLGMSSSELGGYKGKTKLYEGDYTTTVVYEDLGLLYELEPQADDPEAITVIRCYDVKSTMGSFEQSPMTSSELGKKYKESVYRGETTLTASDYAALELLNAKDDIKIKYPFTVEKISEGSYTINPQGGNTVYIESYNNDGYIYTYYFFQRDGAYSFYSVEKAQKPAEA